MNIKKIDNIKFKGSVVIVDEYGRKATPVLQRALTARLGTTIYDLQEIIKPKPFDLFISPKGHDNIGVNANKVYAGVLRGETDYKFVHKSVLDRIIEVAKTSIAEYENFMQKNV